ncbi:MAG: hypothetical protein M1828_006574 [Chrysothrix sp. TS-e1954]|nr:MAG: hypothetical protein M1828_006574 [Chrysothrix sp. TS-e1954]
MKPLLDKARTAQPLYLLKKLWSSKSSANSSSFSNDEMGLIGISSGQKKQHTDSMTDPTSRNQPRNDLKSYSDARKASQGDGSLLVQEGRDDIKTGGRIGIKREISITPYEPARMLSGVKLAQGPKTQNPETQQSDVICRTLDKGERHTSPKSIMAEGRATQLSDSIRANVSNLEKRSAELNVEPVSLDDGVAKALRDDAAATEARRTIAAKASELQSLVEAPDHLMSPPVSETCISSMINEALIGYYSKHNIWTSLHVIAEHKIAEMIPIAGNEGRSFAQLAQLCNLDADIVKRIVRHACTMFIFREEPIGIVHHTASSKVLASNPMMRQYVCMTLGELWPAATKLSQALTTWQNPQEPTESAFNIAHDTKLPFFQFIATQPKREQRFADTMSWVSMSPAFDINHLVNNYDFKQCASGVVVDIGGSHGKASIAIAEQYPDVQCIVQDRPDVVIEGRKLLSSSGKKSISFLEHDFFAQQPVVGASVYFLRQILHDWSDTYATQIIRAVVPAMRQGSKLLIMEQLLPEAGTVEPYQARRARSYDLAMMAMANGKERDIEDWTKLLRATDKRLSITSVTSPVTSAMALIEARLED